MQSSISSEYQAFMGVFPDINYTKRVGSAKILKESRGFLTVEKNKIMVTNKKSPTFKIIKFGAIKQ